MSKEVSILIPNYKTPVLTKLCLRLLKKHTDLSKVDIIVVDNNSQDESLNYLKTLDWITLIERAPEPDDTPPLSHGRALDMLLEKVTTPYVLSIHTDTFVKRDDWLDHLLSSIRADENIAGVGSWKLESKPFIKQLLKDIEGAFQSRFKKSHRVAGKGGNTLFLRSHCALYRTDRLKALPIKFADPSGCVGKAIHEQLLAQGYEMQFLNEEKLIRYMEHFNHATMILNPELGAKKKTQQKGLKRIQKGLKALNAEAVLNDASLD